MLENIFKKLNKEGIACKKVTMCDGSEGIMCDTNYDGQYPSKETYELHYKIRKMIRRYKNATAEERGFHTALLITEEAA